jgi:hypothetical protein
MMGKMAKKIILILVGCVVIITAAVVCLYLSGFFFTPGNFGENVETVSVRWIIPPNYYEGTDFSEGRAWVREKEDGPWTLFDEKGEILREGLDVGAISLYKDGISVIIDIKDKVNNGFYRYSGLVNRSGDIVFEAERGTLMQYGEGLVSYPNNAEKVADIRFGFVDLEHNWVIPPIYKTALPFNEGLAAVTKDGKYGFIDRDGNVTIDFKYDNTLGFFGGMAVVEENSLFGLIDKTGRYIAEPVFEAFIFPWSELIAVQKDGKIGFIDNKGRVAIKFKYRGYGDARGGLPMRELGRFFFDEGKDRAVVIEVIGNKWAQSVIDKTGEEIFREASRGPVSIKGEYLLFFDVDRGYNLRDRDGRAYSFPSEMGKFKRIHLSEDNIFRAEGDGKESQTGYFVVEIEKQSKVGISE